jgi:hypothetical protein
LQKTQLLSQVRLDSTSIFLIESHAFVLELKPSLSIFPRIHLESFCYYLIQAQNLNKYPFQDTDVVKSLEELETSENDKDEYQIRKLYPDATGNRKQEWYFDMNNGEKTDRLRNTKNANLKKEEDDDSWSVTGAKKLEGEGDNAKWEGKGQVRLEGWSESGDKKWLNMEITVYAYYDKDLQGQYWDDHDNKWKKFDPGPYAFQLYGRGGHHSSKDKCEGACYKIGLRKDGDVEVRKEPAHPCYLKDKGLKEGIKNGVKDRWIGLKQVLYNFKNGDRDCVANEIWIDDESDDNGELKISNKWRNVSNVNDTGNWGTQGLDDDDKEKFKDDCPVLDENVKHEHRRAEDIINMPGGTDEGNIGSLRCDIMKLKFKYFSIREIQAPKPDKDAEVA